MSSRKAVEKAKAPAPVVEPVDDSVAMAKAQAKREAAAQEEAAAKRRVIDAARAQAAADGVPWHQ